jgi:hypothetical protein
VRGLLSVVDPPPELIDTRGGLFCDDPVSDLRRMWAAVEVGVGVEIGVGVGHAWIPQRRKQRLEISQGCTRACWLGLVGYCYAA